MVLPGEGRDRDTQGLQQPGRGKGKNTEGTKTRTEGPGGPAPRASLRGRDRLSARYIITRSPINPMGLCLHNRECFGCFMGVDKSSAGAGSAGAGPRDACPTPALPSQPIKAFYFKRDTDFIAQ